MADEATRVRLGRGLATLIGDIGNEPSAQERWRSHRRAPIESIKPNPHNPRRIYAQAELDELVASIKQRGIIQPIVVRHVRNDTGDSYEIIAGERRWRAAQRAGLHEVPIVILDVSDGEALELAIIENVQRTDLNPLEEAGGYEALAQQYGHSHEEIAKLVGKSRSHVANTLRLLRLSEPIKAYINAGKLSAGHARMLVGQPDADALAEEIVNRGLNVRQVEKIARKEGKTKTRAAKKKKDADTLALEKRLSDTLGLQVNVDHRGKWGILHIHYRDLDQLDEVIRLLEGGGSKRATR